MIEYQVPALLNPLVETSEMLARFAYSARPPVVDQTTIAQLGSGEALCYRVA